MTAAPSRLLTALEARVLGVLVEKAATVPDSYPLSLNTLTLGCNQKTARDPVMAVDEGEIDAALAGLRSLHLAHEVSGSRVTRHAHNAPRALGLPSQSVALLATLMLRGPQTVSELRVNGERLHRFADASSVEGFLDELAARDAEKGGPLALRLARAPGAREARWTQLLCGPVDSADLPTRAAARRASGDESPAEEAPLRPEAWIDTVRSLQDELETLRQRVAALERAGEGG